MTWHESRKSSQIDAGNECITTVFLLPLVGWVLIKTAVQWQIIRGYLRNSCCKWLFKRDTDLAAKFPFSCMRIRRTRTQILFVQGRIICPTNSLMLWLSCL